MGKPGYTPVQLYAHGPEDGHTFEIDRSTHQRGELTLPRARRPQAGDCEFDSGELFDAITYRWDGSINDGGYARYREVAR